MTRLNKPQSKLTWLWIVVAVLVLIGIVLALEYFNVVHLGFVRSIGELLRLFRPNG
ncbi:hypothetical protein [Deinococcus sp. Leaf326]|jgi:hypothetical protein|uniref:hypothetical protein n=1 Tax=Deinococcus sp. Leaf326 TaxID=1736338 RepID=UPI000AC17945|nr:hypothetical protein [Deinococcus sp. Leaf326]